jgi:hypothetical protein
MWTPLDPDEHIRPRAKRVLKTTSDDVFIRLYYAGLSILGVCFLDTQEMGSAPTSACRPSAERANAWQRMAGQQGLYGLMPTATCNAKRRIEIQRRKDIMERR